MLSVSNLDRPDNLLARINPKCHTIERQPELFVPPARLANICDMTIGFLVLNHDRKEYSSWRRESDASDITSDSKMVFRRTILREYFRYEVLIKFLNL